MVLIFLTEGKPCGPSKSGSTKKGCEGPGRAPVAKKKRLRRSSDVDMGITLSTDVTYTVINTMVIA